MEQSKNQRKRRSVDERIAELDAKIAYHQTHIDNLKQKKEDLLNPPKTPKKPTMRQITDMIKESDLSLEDVMKLLEKAKK